MTRDEDGRQDSFGYNLAGELTAAKYGLVMTTPNPTATTPTPGAQVAAPSFNPNYWPEEKGSLIAY